MSAQENVVETVEQRPNVTVLETLEAPKAEEPKAKAEPEAATAEPTEEATEEGQERNDKGQFKPKVQERIDEITRQRHEAQREAAYWRGIAETRATQEQPKADAEPKTEDFSDYGEYVRALAKYEAKTLVQAEFAQAREQSQEAAKVTTWQQRVNSLKTELPDFDSVMRNSTAPMTQAMAEAIRESDVGPKVAYHLAQNPEVAARLAGLSPTSAIREIGRIEASLSTAAAPTAPAKRITSAPTPPTPVGSGRSTVGDPGKMSQADYMQWRQSALKESR